MTVTTFSFPTTIRFGVGTLAELPELLSALHGAKPFLVTDRGLVGTETFAVVQRVLRERAVVFSSVRANPVDGDVDSAAEAFTDAGCDSVVAVGGGSALDVGKAVRLRIRRPDRTLHEFDPHLDWSGLAPFVAIPTTAGTGSEVSRSAVIMLEGRKSRIFHQALLADLVLLDPTLTRELPPKLTAATGADALAHCIEAFTSPALQPMCDGIALEGVRLIAQALPAAVKDGGNLEARGAMQIAATMGGIALQKEVGLAHALAHPLSSICGLHHGLADALCLPHVMEFNAERQPGLYRRVGIALGLSRADDRATIKRVRALLSKVGLRGGLRSHGVSESHLHKLTEQAVEDGSHRANPLPVTAEDLRSLYERAL